MFARPPGLQAGSTLNVSPRHRVSKSKWVTKLKPDNNRKARLVVQGWNQIPGRDCGSTLVPVCRLHSIRMVLAIAAHFGREHVQTAFLCADIKEEVFAEEPPAFKTQCKDGRQLVMALGKSLYGLAQSPGNFFFAIDPVLIAIGFEPLKSDTCVYIYQHNRVIIILTLYVDDLLVVGASIEVIGMVKRKLMDKFKMKDMGDVSLVLGMQVTRDHENGTLTISQEKYTKSMLDQFGMADCNPVSTIPSFPRNNRKARCSMKKRLNRTRPSPARSCILLKFQGTTSCTLRVNSLALCRNLRRYTRGRLSIFCVIWLEPQI